jgi:tyrosine-protein kinase Etk/Wzc
MGATENKEVDVSQLVLADEVDVFEMMMWLLRRKKTILFSGLIFALIGLALALSRHNVFTANTEILPPHTTSSSSLMGGAASLSSLGGMASAFESKSAADTYAAMLSARPVQDDLIRRFNLQNLYHAQTLATARAILGADTSVTTTKENFIVISVTDTDPTRAMQLANAYVDALRTLMKSMALTQSSQRRVFIEGQLDTTKEDLARAEANYQQMQQSNHIVSVDLQSKALVDRSSTLSAQIAAKEVQLEALRSYSTEANPQVEIVEKELAAMRGEAAKINTDGQESYSDLGLSSVPHAELSFVRATRELKYQEGLYEQLVTQYEGARMDEAQDAPVVQVIEPAIVPDHKSGPRRSLIVLEAFVLGVIVGSGFAFANGWRASLTEEKRAQFAMLRKTVFGWSSR